VASTRTGERKKEFKQRSGEHIETKDQLAGRERIPIPEADITLYPEGEFHTVTEYSSLNLDEGDGMRILFYENKGCTDHYTGNIKNIIISRKSTNKHHFLFNKDLKILDIYIYKGKEKDLGRNFIIYRIQEEWGPTLYIADDDARHFTQLSTEGMILLDWNMLPERGMVMVMMLKDDDSDGKYTNGEKLRINEFKLVDLWEG